MTTSIETIKQNKGLEFSYNEFVVSFNCSKKEFFSLIKNNVISIYGEYPNNGKPVKKYIIN